jgi:NADPH:quinone reductase-like Zn-dependent oxidoreductase
MALPEGGFSTYARCPTTSVAQIPDTMSFEVAATIPVVFCTAYYSLFDLGQLQPGERVLIHAGAGGVGQAAIMVAQMIGADIFVTVGSLDKKRFLMTQYGISEDRIFYSRDTSFARGIRRATGGVGVDVVINSLAGDLLRETWECLAPFGRFIEIGKADITKNTRLDMLPFENNVTFASVDLTKVAKFRPQLMKRLMGDVCRLVHEKSVHPISVLCRLVRVWARLWLFLKMAISSR